MMDENGIFPPQMAENIENPCVKVEKNNVCVGARATGGVSRSEGGVLKRRRSIVVHYWNTLQQAPT